jgi:hypothetical protein
MTDRRKIGPELVRRVTRVAEVLEENGRLRAEIARMRLTDAEREAVEWYAAGGVGAKRPDGSRQTLRGLLARLD